MEDRRPALKKQRERSHKMTTVNEQMLLTILISSERVFCYLQERICVKHVATMFCTLGIKLGQICWYKTDAFHWLVLFNHENTV